MSHTLEKYQALEDDYKKLQIKYDKLHHRFNSVIKMNDKTFKHIFNKNIKSQKLQKRFNVIIKQSDKQSKHWLVENEKKEQLLSEQSKMALMGNMIENITHQMKQPLSLITTASSSLELKKEMDMLSDEEFAKYTKKIMDASKYLSDTMDNFKNFLHPNSHKESISLTNTIVKSKQLLESKFKGKDIKIIHEVNDIEVILVENDLIQVITNILSNSIDALETIDTKRLIFISTYIDENTITVEFGDSGGGIDPNIIKNIFKPHFTTKSEDKGSGIGLFMSKNIIEEKLKGKIEVSNKEFYYKNQVYKGACFSITIPKI